MPRGHSPTCIPFGRLRSYLCELKPKAAPPEPPLRWKWTFCHLLSRLCHTRLSSDWCVWAWPCLQKRPNVKKFPRQARRHVNRARGQLRYLRGRHRGFQNVPGNVKSKYIDEAIFGSVPKSDLQKLSELPAWQYQPSRSKPKRGKEICFKREVSKNSNFPSLTLAKPHHLKTFLKIFEWTLNSSSFY